MKIDLGSPFLEAGANDAVMTVRINRPEKRNALTQDMYRGLKRAAILVDRDSQLDALCIIGTGDVFAVGGDMSGTNASAEDLASELDPTDHFPFRHFERCRKVIVAAINGLCYAGGLNLVLFSDVSVASDRARFRAPELLRGAPDPWIASRLPEFVGIAAAKYLLFTGAVIDAAEAAALGLVGKVVAHEHFDEHLQWVLEQIRLTGPQARAMIKDHINCRLTVPDVNMFQRSIQSPEMAEGFAAFLEKRRPRWPR